MKKGFTLIELLVVVSIISLLASIVFASLSTAEAKGRDARRKSDFEQLQTALALYYNANGSYPATGATTAVSTNNAHTNPNGTPSALSVWYTTFAPLVTQGDIPSIPIDPINVPTGVQPWGTPVGFSVNRLYYYLSNGTIGGTDATFYLLCTWMENQSDRQTLQFTDVADPFTPGNYLHANDGYSAYSYCVRSPS